MSTEILAQAAVKRLRRLHTVEQFCQKHPAFTPGGVRWMLFNREANGLAKAIVRVGRRILIDEERFFDWIDEQNEAVGK